MYYIFDKQLIILRTLDLQKGKNKDNFERINKENKKERNPNSKLSSTE